MKRIVVIGLLVKEATRGWIQHRAQRLGASLAFYTTGVFAELKDSLDTIWEVKRKPGIGL